MEATGMAELRQAHRAWGTSGRLQARSPGLARGQTGARMWHKATVLPAGTQVGCFLALVLPASNLAAVAPVFTDAADESAVFSLEAGYSPGVAIPGEHGMSAVLWTLHQVHANLKC